MRIGIIGLGHIGFPLATFLHSENNEIHSWTRKERFVNWQNSINLGSIAGANLDFLIIASGATRPSSGDRHLELSSTIELISDTGVRPCTRILYISSGAVYGNCITPRSEIHTPLPTTNYGFAKLSAEQALLRKFGEQIISLRVGNLIDELNPYGIARNLRMAVSDNRISFYGLPSDSRDFMGISDFVLAVKYLLELDKWPEVLNIGSGKSIELSFFVELLNAHSKFRMNVDWHERRSGDLAQTKLDISLMKNLLKFEPQDPVIKLSEFLFRINP